VRSLAVDEFVIGRRVNHALSTIAIPNGAAFPVMAWYILIFVEIVHISI
jgi:hypothetical protein